MRGMSGRRRRLRSRDRHRAMRLKMILSIDSPFGLRRRHSQRGRIDVAGLPGAVVALKIEQGSLHAKSVNAIPIERSPTRCTIAFLRHHSLQIANPLVRLSQAHYAVVHDESRLNALPKLCLHRKATTGQVVHVVLELPVVSCVHFDVHMHARSRRQSLSPLRAQRLPIADGLIFLHGYRIQMPNPCYYVSTFPIHDFHHAATGDDTADVTSRWRRDTYRPGITAL